MTRSTVSVRSRRGPLLPGNLQIMMQVSGVCHGGPCSPASSWPDTSHAHGGQVGSLEIREKPAVSTIRRPKYDKFFMVHQVSSIGKPDAKALLVSQRPVAFTV